MHSLLKYRVAPALKSIRRMNRAPRRWACFPVLRESVSTKLMPVMFTLCMSRGHPPLQDSHCHNHLTSKPVKGGYLLRYRRGFFCKNWSEEWIVLYEDSTIAFYADKGLSRPRGRVRISEAPDLLAVGEWTRQVPKPPRMPRSCHIRQLLVVGTRYTQEIYWLMAQSPGEVNDWMTAISNTLPPPPHLPLEDKRCSLTSLGDVLPHAHNPESWNKKTNNANNVEEQSSVSTVRKNDADYTVLSGVVIDWGHGWGWGQSAAWATQAACAHEAAANSTVYCHAEDYTVGGYEEVDWSSFGDFCF